MNICQSISISYLSFVNLSVLFRMNYLLKVEDNVRLGIYYARLQNMNADVFYLRLYFMLLLKKTKQIFFSIQVFILLIKAQLTQPDEPALHGVGI